jgi:NitT/TauT family transport system permease protein
MINAAGSAFQTDRVFVGIFVIAAVGLLLTAAIHLLERRFESWRPQATSR